MKYGVLYHRYTQNLGDDIQAYASSRFLPQIDYMVDREELDTFQSENNEAVSVIMSAWMFRKKWNWPPAPNIFPFFVGMHMIRKGIEGKASPITDECFQGIGGDYLRNYGPIGCRDKVTAKVFRKLSIDSFFSGCITLTLPNYEKVKPKKDYICLVDLPKDVEDKIKNKVKGKIEVRTYSHINTAKKPYHEQTWEERTQNVEERLKIYQNAKCVVTIRLHATLPCLAMGVPVLWVLKNPNWGRFNPYRDWARVARPKDILNDNYNFDFINPEPNAGNHLKTRKRLIRRIKKFIKENKDKDTIEDFIKTTYTEEERKEFQYNLMKTALDKWLRPSMDMVNEIKALKQEQSEKHSLKKNKKMISFKQKFKK